MTDASYPPLIDYRSAYQNGLLDSIRGCSEAQGMVDLGSMLRKHYCEGYREGDFLLYEQEQEENE